MFASSYPVGGTLVATLGPAGGTSGRIEDRGVGGPGALGSNAWEWREVHEPRAGAHGMKGLG
eukprot:6173261-Pyramimonas_sp.AAC.1